MKSNQIKNGFQRSKKKQSKHREKKKQNEIKRKQEKNPQQNKGKISREIIYKRELWGNSSFNQKHEIYLILMFIKKSIDTQKQSRCIRK